MQPNHPTVSRCGEADGDHYFAIVADRKGVSPNGPRTPVPNTKMKWDAGNPTGHGIILLRPELARPRRRVSSGQGRGRVANGE
jgi:hypothetical protein